MVLGSLVLLGSLVNGTWFPLIAKEITTFTYRSICLPYWEANIIFAQRERGGGGGGLKGEGREEDGETRTEFNRHREKGYHRHNSLTQLMSKQDYGVDLHEEVLCASYPMPTAMCHVVLGINLSTTRLLCFTQMFNCTLYTYILQVDSRSKLIGQ